MEKKGIGKYRFVFLGLSAAFLIVFGIVIAFNKSLAEQIILYVTGGVILIFGVIRFVPLMSHLSDKKRVIMNAIEIFSNILIAIGLIVIAVKIEEHANLLFLYKYLLAAVLMARGIIFMVEGLYCDGEKEVSKFIVHLVFIICATTLVTLKDFDMVSLRYLMIGIAFLGGAYCTVDGYISFNRYRKLYVNKEKNDFKETNVSDRVDERPIMEKEIEERPMVQ